MEGTTSVEATGRYAGAGPHPAETMAHAYMTTHTTPASKTTVPADRTSTAPTLCPNRHRPQQKSERRNRKYPTHEEIILPLFPTSVHLIPAGFVKPAPELCHPERSKIIHVVGE